MTVLTRIKNNQLTDASITGSKFVNKTVTGGLLADNLTYSSNLTISGNLTVNGTTTTVDATNTVIADPLLVLSRGEAGTPSSDSGFIVERGTSDNVGFIWDESADVFAAVVTTEDGTTAGNITISSYANAKVGDIEASTASLGNIDFSGNSITSTNLNGNITLTPNGTGDINLGADTVVVGDSNSNAKITTNGTGDLTIDTNSGTNSGSIVIADGINGNISVTPNGTGEVVIATAAISDLTSGRVVLAGTSGAIEDSGNLTFNGSTLAVTGAVTVSTTLGVTGESTLASATVSDLTSGRVVLAGTAGAIEDSGNLTFDGTTLTTTALAVDNVSVNGNTITTSAGNLSIDSTGGEITLSSAAISDLTSGRVVLAGTAGAIQDNANLTFNGSTLAVTGAVTVSTTLGVTGESTLASATISDLTSGRVVLAGTSGAIQDSANLTFDGTTLTVSGDAAIDNVTVNGNTISTSAGNLSLSSTGGEVTASSLAVSDLTSGRVVLAGTSGALQDNGNLTFNGSTLAVTGAVTVSTTLGVTGESTLASATISDLTSGRVVLAGTSGAVEDSANLTFNGTTLTVSGALAVDNVSVDGNTITTSAGNLSLSSFGGEVTASSLAVSDLTNNRVVIAGASGAIEDDANFTFDGTTLSLTAGMNITGDLDVDNLNLNGNAITSTNSNGNINITPNGTGEVIMSTAAVSDLTSGRVVLAGTGGAVEDSANLTFNGTVLTTTKITVDNISIDGDTISSAHNTITIDPATAGSGGTVVIAGNLQVTGTTTTVDSTVVTIADPVFQIGADSNDGLDRGIKALYNTDGSTSKVAFFGIDDTNQEFIYIADATDTSSVFSGSLGSAAFGSLRVTDLTNNRVLIGGASGEIEDSANLTFDGTTLTVSGAAAIDNVTIDGNTISTSAGNLTIDSNGNEVLIDSLTINDLTSGRVVLAGTSGSVGDSSNLTFNGTTLTTTALAVDNVSVDGNTVTTSAGNLSLSSTGGEVTTSSLAVSDLTSGRVTYAGASGALVDSANMTFNGTDLTVASAKVSDLTSGRVVLAGTSGAIEDSGNLTFNGSTLAVTGAVTVSSTLGVTGESTLASATVSDLTSGRVVLAGTSGAIEDSANLTFDGTTLTTTALAVDNISINGNAITSTDLNGNISLTPNGTGEVVASTLSVSDLTSGRVVLAGTSGALQDSGNLTFNGSTLAVTGAVTVSSTLGVTGESTLASATVSDLTSGRVVLAGTAGAIEDSGNLTFNGTTLTTTALAVDNVSVDGNTVTTSAGNLSLSSTGGEVTASSLAVSDLTSGRVVLAGASGALQDNGNLTFNGSTLAVTGAVTVSSTLGVTGESTLASATVSDLTSGRVVLAGTSGAIEDSANLTFNGTVLTTTKITVDNVSIDANSITSSNNLTLDAVAAGEIAINEAGADVNTRIEASGQANAVFVEGSSGNVGIKTATPNAGADLHVNSTSSIIIPVGTTAQRPTAATGMTRFNTTTTNLEFYNGSEWISAGSEFTIITADDFAGDGSTVAFTLSESATSAGVIVAINGVVQDPGTAYSVSGTTLTFTEAPASSDVIDVRILSTTSTVVEIADLNTSLTVNDTTETVTSTVNGNVVMQVTNAAVVPGANVSYNLGSSSLQWSDVYAQDLTLSGNLTVNGTTTTVSSTNTVISDTLIELNTGAASNVNDMGIVMERGSTGNNAFMGWDESADQFIVGTTTATGSSTGNLTITKGTMQANIVGDVTGNVTGSSGSCTGNAATATALQTARTIGGVSFDGTANINLPGVNTAGNQNTSGNAATATTATNVTATANNATNETVYVTFVDGATGAQGIETDTGLTYNPSTNTLTTTNFAGQATTAKYADLAEKYTADQHIEPGTVVCFGGSAEVTVCDHDMDRRVAGVVSTNPAHLMNSGLEAEHTVELALQGRVPCKVIGPVVKGDMMVSAGNGHARAEENPSYGSVIGKALENFDGDTGVIEVVVGRM